MGRVVFQKHLPIGLLSAALILITTVDSASANDELLWKPGVQRRVPSNAVNLGDASARLRYVCRVTTPEGRDSLVEEFVVISVREAGNSRR